MKQMQAAMRKAAQQPQPEPAPKAEPKPAVAPRCGNCIFAHVASLTYCRRHPPQTHALHGHVAATFPAVLPDWVCGEWKGYP